MSVKSNGVVPSLHSSSTELTNQIERILHSEVFAGSETLRKLLVYLSARAIEGRLEPIRVREIATEVFGRSENFDSQSDSVVRVHTGRLRSKLAEYYMEEGAEDDLIVTIPKGGYTLAYHSRQAVPPAMPVPPNPAELREVMPERGSPATGSVQLLQKERSLSLPWMAAVTVSAILLGWFANSAVQSKWERNQLPPVLRTFWQNFTAKGETPLIVFSNFRLIRSANAGLITYAGPEDPSKPIVDTYTSMGEVTGVFEVSRILLGMGKSATVKRGRLLTWDEAKDQNLIFVGGPLAETPLRDVPILKDFRFGSRSLSDGSTVGAILNARPKQGELPVYFASDSLYSVADIHASKVDYAVVALRSSLSDNHSILILAGISEYGTQGAAEFVTREASVKDLLAKLRVHPNQPMPWFEALLRVRVEGGVPVQSDLVAVHRIN